MCNRILIASLVILPLAAPLFAQEKFDSAEAAAQAVIDAAGNHDTARLEAIFGPQANAILTSGSPKQDTAEQSQFAQLAHAKHQLIIDPRDSNRVILSIGEEGWSFPVPIVRSKGKWGFDASETGTEMHARRIGTDELDAIEICAGYVDAQRTFASEDRDKDGLLKYAPHMMAAANRRNGLYSEGETEPLVPRALAEATLDGDKKPVKPYHGYYFRILDAQGPDAPGGAHNYLAKGKLIGGFGLVAWPAQYGVTGINTFMVNQDGIIYQKDIPPAAPGATAPPVTRYDPDPSWKPVE